MIPRRVWINLAVFAGLFLLLMNWAARSILSIDAIDRPYTVTADFSSSPGLRNNLEVTYRGVRVGTVDGVNLEGGAVRVSMDIDRGAQLPDGLRASILRKSAVGEPYVSLEAEPDYAGGGPFAEPGYHIPVDRTSVPVEYGELFSSLDALLSKVPEQEFALVVHELALALEGRSDDLRAIVRNGASVTATLAERTDLFDALASELTNITHNLTENRETISGSLDDLSELTGTLAASSDNLERLLATAPDFGDAVARMLTASVDDLGCAIDGIGGLFGAIGTEERVAELISLLETSGLALEALDSALIETGEDGADGPYLGGSFDFTNALEPGAAPPLYDPHPTLPEAGEVASCADSDRAGAGAVGDAATSPPTGDAKGSARNTDQATEQKSASSDEPDVASSVAPAEDQRFPTEAALAAAGVALAIVLLAAIRPWRLLPGRKGR